MSKELARLFEENDIDLEASEEVKERARELREKADEDLDVWELVDIVVGIDTEDSLEDNK